MKHTNTELLCFALGWQGGTIHQVSEETGLPVQEILSLPLNASYINEMTTAHGWFAVKTCSIKHLRDNVFHKRKGDVAFWSGAATAVQDSLGRNEPIYGRSI